MRSLVAQNPIIHICALTEAWRLTVADVRYYVRTYQLTELFV